jgi:hypothetical protein
MTEITSPEVTITAEDLEFVPARPYLARHACGVVIAGVGADMHDAIVEHTHECEEGAAE